MPKVSVPYCPSPCRKMDSNRRLWRGFTPPCRRCLFHFPRARPGKWTLTDTSEEALHGQAAPEPKSYQFLIVLLLFWPLLEGQFDFIFFCLLAVRPNKQKAPNRHLPKQTDTCPNRQTLAQTDRHLQTDTCPKIIRKSSYVKVNFAIRAWLNSTSSCRELVPNGRLQRGPKINKKAYEKKGASEVSVCICHGPVQENGT